MRFIVLLLCLGIERFFEFDNWFKPKWVQRYILLWRSVLKHLKYDWLQVVVLILPLLLLLAIVNWLLAGYAFGLWHLLLTIILLLGCINGRSIKGQLKDYFSAFKRQDETAILAAGHTFLGEHKISDVTQLIHAVTKKIFLCSYEQLFAPFFWFAIIGIYGAVLYFMLNVLAVNKSHPHAAVIKAWLDWIPQRLLALSFALVGQFTHEFSWLQVNFKRSPKKSSKFLDELSMHALRTDLTDNSRAELNENIEALALVNRALIIWLVAIALVTFGIWIS